MDAIASLMNGAVAPEARPPAQGAPRPTAATSGFGPALARALSGATDRTGDGPMAPDQEAATDAAGAVAAASGESDAANETGKAASEAGTAAAADGDGAANPLMTRAKVEALMPATESVQRSTEELVPEFRSRLDRVIARMRDEFGLEVRVVETFRSQERQDRLYAQGRSQSGPTVTWTRSSNHTLGRAADVRIEGAPDEAAAYRLLARVAGEEGLRTLGPADPGHLELPPGVKGDRTAAAPTSDQAYVGGLRVASVARVAQVASAAGAGRVAPVAQVATVAGSGGMTRVQRSANASSSAAASVRAATADARVAAGPVESQPDDTQDPAQFDNGGGDEVFAALARGTGHAQSSSRGANVAGANGTDIAARVARLVALQDAVQQAPTTGVTLLLNGEDGGIDTRIRLGLRGGMLDTTIDVTDPLEAVRLAGRSDELRQILERRGLDPAAVRIREAAESAGGWLPQGARTAAPRADSETSNNPSGSWRRDPGANEQRNSRRNAKEDRQ